MKKIKEPKFSNQKILNIAANFMRKSEWINALEIYNKIIDSGKGDANIIADASFAYLQTGKYQKSYELMEKILDYKKMDAEFISNFSIVCARLGLIEKAEYLINFAIKIQPRNINFLLNLVSIFNIKGDYLRAIETLRLAIEHNPLHAQSYGLMGITFLKINENTAARDCFTIALKIDPDYTEAKFNIAAIETREKNTKLAIALYEDLLINSGSKLNDIPAEAIKFNLGTLYLTTGDLHLGWKYLDFGFHPNVPFEYRRNPSRNFLVPKWNGVIQKNKTILFWREQGVGDEIAYLSCVTDLVNTEINIILECDKRLINIVSRSFPKFTVRAETFDNNSHDKMALNNDYDFHFPIGSLPRLFRPNIESFLNKPPYFIIDQDLAKTHENNLKNLCSGKIRVGICWRSGHLNAERAINYTELKEWKPILCKKNIDFINLQYDDCENDLLDIEEDLDIKIHRWAELDLKNDFDSTIALISRLDLVITVGTAVCPMAASIGIPVYLMSHKGMENLGTDFYPWFNSVVCFFSEDNKPVSSSIEKVEKYLDQMNRI